VAEFKITGQDAFFRKLAAVEAKFVRRGVRAAASRAMRPVRDAARAGWRAKDDPETSANIAKNVALSSRFDTRTNEVKARVGIRGGARAAKGDPLNTGHWRFLELGTSEMPAEPVMIPALMSNVATVAQTFFVEAEKELDKALGP
jgi:HK97 gp10 family phage protein